MVHVRRLKLQCMEKLRHVEVLAGYKHLTDLDMTVSKPLLLSMLIYLAL